MTVAEMTRTKPADHEKARAEAALNNFLAGRLFESYCPGLPGTSPMVEVDGVSTCIEDIARRFPALSLDYVRGKIREKIL